MSQSDQLKMVLRQVEQRLAETQEKSKRLRLDNAELRTKLEAERTELDEKNKRQAVREKELSQQAAALRLKEQPLLAAQEEANKQLLQIRNEASSIVVERERARTQKEAAIEKERNQQRMKAVGEARSFRSIISSAALRDPHNAQPCPASCAKTQPRPKVYSKRKRDHGECRMRQTAVPETMLEMEAHWPDWKKDSVKVGPGRVVVEGEVEGVFAKQQEAATSAFVIPMTTEAGDTLDHPHNRVRLALAACGGKGANSHCFYGGSYDADLDGPDPTADATLVKVIKRHFQAMAGTAFPATATFHRFVDLNHRTPDGDAFTHSYFICNLQQDDPVTIKNVVRIEEVVTPAPKPVKSPAKGAEEKEEKKDGEKNEDGENKDEEKEKEAAGGDESMKEEKEEEPQPVVTKKTIPVLTAQLTQLTSLLWAGRDRKPSVPVVVKIIANLIEEMLAHVHAQGLLEVLKGLQPKKATEDVAQPPVVDFEARGLASQKVKLVTTETKDLGAEAKLAYFERPKANSQGPDKQERIRQGQLRCALLGLNDPSTPTLRSINTLLNTLGCDSHENVHFASRLATTTSTHEAESSPLSGASHLFCDEAAVCNQSR